jgi:hypothetical protein
MVDRFNRQKHFDKNDFDKLAGTIDALARALENAGTEERLQGAATIEGVFERFGWARAGLKSEKRKKKTAQHKALIARLRGEPDTPA